MRCSQAKVPFCKNRGYLHGRFPLDCHGFLAQNARKLHILNVYLHIFQCHHPCSQKVRLIHYVDRHLHALLRAPRGVPFSHSYRTVLTVMLQMLQQLPSKPSMVHGCYCACCCNRCSTSSLPYRPAAVKAHLLFEVQFKNSTVLQVYMRAVESCTPLCLTCRSVMASLMSATPSSLKPDPRNALATVSSPAPKRFR